MQKTKLIMKIDSYSNGKLSLSVEDWGVKADLKGLIDLCNKNYGGYVKLEMSAPYKSRSLEENSKWWAMCTEYGNYLGIAREEVAIGVKYRAMEEGLWEGEKIPFSKNGEMKPVSTTQSDIQQMATLIEVLYRIAAEDGYVFEN